MLDHRQLPGSAGCPASDFLGRAARRERASIFDVPEAYKAAIKEQLKF
jgi:hypothetical protein